MIRVVIVEDEVLPTETLKKYIAQYSAETGLAYDVKSYDNPVDFLEEYKVEYDIIFLDIVMPDMDGIRVAHKIRERDENVPIIFVTNMKQYAIKGYEVGALDFIVKPITYYGFEIAFRKALRELARRTETQLTIPVKGGAKRISISALRYVEVSRHRLIYHLDGEDVDTGGSLKDLYEVLYKYGFRRCNHCYIINMRYVKEVLENSVILGPGQEELQISRSKKKEFMAELLKYWGG